jgi:hypothetical protein
MNVQDARAFCNEFCDLAGGRSQLSHKFSDPWQPKDRMVRRIPQEDSGGIYLFTEPVAPADDGRGEVWYIGTSNASLGGRIWSHLGRVYDPATGKVFDPPFKEHGFFLPKGISENVPTAIETGEVVVYTVSIKPTGAVPGWPAVLEKYLLVRSYLLDRRIPILNQSM